jgi:hypothetical protein
MVIRTMRGTTPAAAATIRAVGAGQRQGSCDHAGGVARAGYLPGNLSREEHRDGEDNSGG